VLNADWPSGVAGSIRCAVNALRSRAEVRAVVLAVADQPRISVGVVERLIEAWRADAGRRVGSRYAGTLGVPALFGREAFPALARLEGDRGAQRLLVEDPHAFGVDWPDGALDVDVPGDLPPGSEPGD
jgi:molybdenum cofactor cytidylyltransferase